MKKTKTNENVPKKNDPKKATIKDVADLAGVSIKTVSRVVNKENDVRDITRDNVLKAIKTLKYTPNLSARGLAGRHSFLLALLYTAQSSNYILQVQNGALTACRHEDFDLLIHPCDVGASDLFKRIQLLVTKSRIAGLILTPPLSDMIDLQRKLLKAKIPFVRIAPAQHEDFSPFVYCDDELAAFRMTEYLISLGHKYIGFVKGHPDHGASQLRFTGYKNALKQAGIPVNRQLIKQGYFDFASGVRCAKQLLIQQSPPTAVFACNDDMAAGVLFAAHEMHISVPGDFSVVGFDDTPVAKQVWPSLTTVNQPITDMAETATKILLATIRNVPESQPVRAFQCTLQFRDSTAVCK